MVGGYIQTGPMQHQNRFHRHQPAVFHRPTHGVGDLPTCAADADLLAEIERLRERATTYGLVAAVAVALALITIIVASNAQTASAATARASLTPPRPAPKVVSYPSLAPEQVEQAPYRSPFDSPTI